MDVEANGGRYRRPAQPTAVVCLDGVDPTYLEDAFGRGLVPRLGELAEAGAYLDGRSQLPSFTNPNNLSIVTGGPPSLHGLPGNHYLDPDGNEVQLDRPEQLRAPSIHAAMAAAGVRVLAVTTKEKLRRLLSAGGVPCVSAERAEEQGLAALESSVRAAVSVPAMSGGLSPAESVAAMSRGLSPVFVSELVGRPKPDIFDWDASHYALELGLALGTRLGIELLYVSLTDAVQHAAAPGSELSDRYLVRLDELVGDYLDAGWTLGLVADHGMNAKTRADGSPNVRFLGELLDRAGVAGARVVLPITDPYVVHHAALGSACWVHLPEDELDAARAVLEGVERSGGGHDPRGRRRIAVAARRPHRRPRRARRPEHRLRQAPRRSRPLGASRPAPLPRRPPRAGGADPALHIAGRARAKPGDERGRPPAAARGGVTATVPSYEPPCLIGGAELHGEGRIEVIYPYTGELVGTAPLLPRAAIRQALDLASNAVVTLDRHERSSVLSKVADAIAASARELAEAITRESGLCLADTHHEVTRAVDVFSFAARAALHDDGELFACDISANGRPRRAFTTREPVRLAAAITPFNHPLNQVAHKLAPAIAAGAPIVLKPSEKTPLAALWLGRAVLEAGYPADAVAVVTGAREAVLEEMLVHEATEVVMFTGGVEVGQLIAGRGGYRRVVLELGGNDPLLVLRDADLDEAARLAVEGGTRNSGQRCTAVKRIIAEAPVAEALAERIAARAALLRVGDPLDPATDVGTLIDEEAAVRIERRVATAVGDGAQLLHGGERAGAQIVPPVLDGVDPEASSCATRPSARRCRS